MGEEMERLSKVLSQAGVASRRKAEELIASGKVKVNGVVVTVLGTKVKEKDAILVNDQPIRKETLYYYLLNKPTGYLSTVADEHKRRNILDLFDAEAKQVRLYPIHKLEYDTAGVLIVTNDGVLTKKLTMKNAGIEKEYLVRTEGIIIKDKIRKLRSNMKSKEVIFTPKYVGIVELDKVHKSTLVRIVIGDETNKQIRELFESIGHKVKSLTRIRFDFLTSEGVERGSYRMLKAHEIKKLYRESVL